MKYEEDSKIILKYLYQQEGESASLESITENCKIEFDHALCVSEFLETLSYVSIHRPEMIKFINGKLSQKYQEDKISIKLTKEGIHRMENKRNDSGNSIKNINVFSKSNINQNSSQNKQVVEEKAEGILAHIISLIKSLFNQ